MDPKWHIAFCNVTFTGYAGVSYADYYGSPAVMLETQLAAAEYAESHWGVGHLITPRVESPSCAFASWLGMPVVVPDSDELPYVDTRRPIITDPSDIDAIELDYLVAADISEFLTSTAIYVLDQGYYDLAKGFIDTNAADILAIELDYVVAADISAFATITQIKGWDTALFNVLAGDISGLAGEIDDITADYLVALDLSTHATAVTGIHGVAGFNVASTDDIGELDDRIADIEADYTTADQASGLAWIEAEALVEEHEDACSNFQE